MSWVKSPLLCMIPTEGNLVLLQVPPFQMPLLHHISAEEQISIIELCFRRDIRGRGSHLAFQAEK